LILVHTVTAVTAGLP